MDIKFVYEIFLAVLTLLILVVPGFILAKMKFIGKTADSVLSTIVLYVCQPLMLVMSFQKTEFSSEILVNMLIVAGLAVLIHGIMIAIVMIFIRDKDGDGKKRVLRFAAVFSNCGYMGIPFLTILYGAKPEYGEVLVYAGVVIGVFNLLGWTVGAYMITGDKKQASLKKAILNPNIIGLIIGVLLFVILQKPLASVAQEGGYLDLFLEKIAKSFNFFADMVTPLSMTVIGIKLSQCTFKTIFGDKTAYLSSFLKLIVMALVSIVCVAFLPISNVVKCVLFFTLAMPSATMTVLLAVQNGGDAESATANVLLSTLLSIATIPLMYMLFAAIIGL